MTVYYDGNVGIGTTSSPTSKLAVDGDAIITGDLVVTGNIVAGEEYVLTETSAPTIGTLGMATLACSDNQTVKWDESSLSWTCANDDSGLTNETDPTIQAIPNCAEGEVLKKENGQLICVSSNAILPSGMVAIFESVCPE